MDAVLTIESEEAVRLAEQLAALTGASVQEVVIRALADRVSAEIRQHDARLLAAELLGIGQRCAAKLQGPLNSADHAELYGDDGMPA